MKPRRVSVKNPFRQVATVIISDPTNPYAAPYHKGTMTLQPGESAKLMLSHGAEVFAVYGSMRIGLELKEEDDDGMG